MSWISNFSDLKNLIIDMRKPDIILVIKHVRDTSNGSYNLRFSGNKLDLITSLKNVPIKTVVKAIEKLLPQYLAESDDDDLINPNSTKEYLLDWLKVERKEDIVHVIEVLNRSGERKLASNGKKDELLKRLKRIPREDLWKAIDKMIDETLGDED